MKQFLALIEKAKANPKHIVLAEGEDMRVIEGAARAAREGLCRVTLIGNPNVITPKISQYDGLPKAITILDHTECPAFKYYTEQFHALRYHKGVTLEQARTEVLKPVNYANLMVLHGAADGSVAGATHATADVVRSALQIIGLNPQHSLVSSLFVMMLCEEHHAIKGGVIFSDCGLVIEPTPEQLAQIAIAASESGAALLGVKPSVAMLSFATHDSAKSASADKVLKATEIIKQKRPDLRVDGGLQFDAAFIPSIGKSKAPQSDVAGQANIFVFPDLHSGNIGYKIAERIGGAHAIGPVLQGLNKPANDLSRGCDAEAVYSMIAVTAVQAASMTEQL